MRLYAGAMALEFVRELEFEYGRVDRVAPRIRRVIANNPGPFTYLGTGTYIVGTGEVAVIDPGPDDPVHLAALEAALMGETVTHIFVTHTHRDHSPGALPLRERTKAPTYAFGPHPHSDEPPEPITAEEAQEAEKAAAEKTTTAQTEAEEGDPAGSAPNPQRLEDSYDAAFSPDIHLRDGDVVNGTDWSIEAVYTPGHISNHLCFALREERALFSGDHVMGWSTSVISPPAGDMTAYLASLAKLLDRPETTYWPTHGPALTEPLPYVRGLIGHRQDREAGVLRRVAAGDRSVGELVTSLYVGLDPRLVKAAGRSVLAHLRKLVAEGRVDWEPDPGYDTGVPNTTSIYYIG